MVSSRQCSAGGLAQVAVPLQYILVDKVGTAILNLGALARRAYGNDSNAGGNTCTDAAG